MRKDLLFEPHHIDALLPETGFRDSTVLVLGDLMLDRYISGDVTRISPEAPVPVLAVRQERTVAGGSANVTLNVAGLKARALIAGVIGDDPAGRCLAEMLSQAGVDTRGLLIDSTRPTTCKTRVISGHHQIVRLDEEVTHEISEDLSKRLLEKVHHLLSDGVSGVILSDYGKGVLGIKLTKAVIAECRGKRIPVIVDPKRDHYAPYAGATCITPNQKEFNAAIRAMGIVETDLAAACLQLRSRLDCGTLLITQGANGMTLITPEQAHHLAALAEEVFDVSGAGDTVIAVLTTGLAAGLDLLTSVQLANAAASLVVRRIGTAPVAWEELYTLVRHRLPPANQILLGGYCALTKAISSNLI